jgi:hypothetical protein
LGSDIYSKVLRADPDVDAGLMAGDRCFNLPWSGKGKNLLAHVMTLPRVAACTGQLSQWIPHGGKSAFQRP